MKKQYLLIVFLLVNYCLNAQWFWQYPSQTGSNNLNKIFFTSSDIGWSVGETGIIKSTTDGGSTWNKQNSGVSADLSGVYFINSNNGISVGDMGMILRTVNGGASWQIQQSGTTNKLYDVVFTDSDNGFVTGASGVILKSTDGGVTWQNRNSNTSVSLVNLCSIGNNNVWALGDSVISKSTDAGETWRIINTTGNSFVKIKFVNLNTGWALNKEGSLYRTDNGGESWLLVINNIAKYKGPISLSVFQNGMYVAYYAMMQQASSEGIVNLSTDGGNTWASYSAPGNINDIFIGDVNKAWLAGESGAIYFTSNFGQSWQTQTVSSNSLTFKGTAFTDDNNGWAIAQRAIIRTTDGGTNWKLLPYSMLSFYNYYGIAFPDANNGTVVGNYNSIMEMPIGAIFHTSDGGNSWVKQNIDNLQGVYSTAFSDVNNGVVVGSSGAVYKTTNSGSSWTKLNSGTNKTLYGVSFPDPQNIIAVGDSGVIIKSSDGGNTWIVKYVSANNALRGVSFRDGMNGWIVGESGKIIQTTNGGSNWIYKETGMTVDLNSVQFLDIYNIIIAGNNGTVLRSKDGGATWSIQNTDTKTNFYGVCFRNPQTGWIVGQNSSILKTTNGGYNGLIDKKNNEPQSFVLSQNYPNPFNPTTQINYSVPKECKVTLKVYDILGHEVATLVNGTKSAGSYMVSFDASKLSTGVYIYRLEAGANMFSKKLMLIK